VAAAALLALLAVSNVMANRVIPRAAYVPWNVTVTGAVVLLAGAAGAGLADLGVTAGRAARRWTVLVVAAIVAALAAGAALPLTQELFLDRRVTATGWAAVAYETLVRIPAGTVLLEELAFRGALPAVLRRWFRPWPADLAASLLFGLWHVLPAWNVATANPVARDLLDGPGARPIAVTAAVMSTTAVGLAFCWLRRRGDSLAVPLGAHTAANSTGYLLAYLVRP
jgi:membrane protease YdiL (CAAX protease family)